MSRKVTQEQLIQVLQSLDLVDDITFYPSIHRVGVDKTNKWYQNIGGKCLNDVVSKLDKDDNDIIADLQLLLNHLGLEITEKKDRRIQKAKKGKK